MNISVFKPSKRGNPSPFHKNSVVRNKKNTEKLNAMPEIQNSPKFYIKSQENLEVNSLYTYANDDSATQSAVYYQIMSPTMDRRPRINVLANNSQWLKFLIDTGASKCVIVKCARDS